MSGLLDYTTLLNYQQGLLQNDLEQEELNARLNRDFSPQDYLLSSDPYTQAIKQNDLERY